MESSAGHLKMNEIRCPYCRKKQIGVLPYYEELNLEKVCGVNHIDLNKIVIDNKPIEISRKELYELKETLEQNNEYCPYKKDMIGVNKINTLTNCYTIKSDYNEIISQFEIDTGLNFCKLDDFADK